MSTDKAICLIFLIGITTCSALADPGVQKNPASSGRQMAPKAYKQSSQILKAIDDSKKTNAAQRLPASNRSPNLITTPINSTQSARDSRVPKASAASSDLTRKSADGRDGSTVPVKASRQIIGGIQRKKGSGLKELLKDEFDGPIHPVSTNNKNF